MIKIDKILSDKRISNIIYIILAVGILMLAMGNNLFQMRENPESSRSTTLSDKAEDILSEIKGVGRVSVMISYEGSDDKQDMFISSRNSNDSKASSVLVVADGGANKEIKEKIVRAVKAALGVESHKIEVFERNEKR